jgi:NTP pyrophosphatase (non-canonical NTP hydrolase)
MKKIGEIQKLIEEILEFRNARDWAQFHDGKNLAISLSVEASELLELFLWKKDGEVDINKLKDEVGDVIYSALLIAHTFKLDVAQTVRDKLAKNEKKYPVSKSKGSNRKYDEL